MKVTELHLENIQSYTSETISFDSGETLIYGENAAGKTTILRAIFGALFQDRSATQIHSGYTLDKLVRKGETRGQITLTFEVQNESYTIEWVLTATTTPDGERKYDGTEKCVLTSPALDAPVEGVKSVRQTVQKLIGMDAQSFVNSVYVQQGDITRLLYATDKERREIFDSLLGLKEIDTRIERLDESRLGINDKLSETKTRIEDIQDRLEELPETEGIQTEINALQTESQQKKDEISTLKKEIKQKKNEIESLQEKKEGYTELQEKLSEVTSELEDCEEELREYNSKLEKLDEEQLELTEKQETIQDEIREKQEELDIETGEISEVEEKIGELEEEREQIKEKINELKTKKETKKTEKTHIEESIETKKNERTNKQEQKENLQKEIKTLSTTVDSLEKEKAELTEKYTEKSKELRTKAVQLDVIDAKDEVSIEELSSTKTAETISAIGTEIETLKEEIGEIKAKKEYVVDLQETGVCPICKSTHENLEEKPDVETVSHKVEEIETKIDSLDAKRGEIESLRTESKNVMSISEEITEKTERITDVTEEITEKTERCNSLQEEISELQTTIEDLKTEKKEAEDGIATLETEITKKTDTLENIETEISEYTSLVEKMELYYDIEDDIESIDDTISNKEQLQKKTEKERHKLEEEKEEVTEKMGEIAVDEIQSQIQSLKTDISEIEDEKKVLENEREEKRDTIAELKATREQIREERNRLQDVKDEREWMQERKDEVLALKQNYKEVKQSLREENLALLNKFTNEVFEELHQGRSIQSIEIDTDYSIDLIKQDNSRISPDMSSGGESNTVNLAIRAGIYKLISEREGHGMLPPFILDEPTQFLDDVHIGELQSFISAIKKWDIPQLLIVSHESSLIETANSVIHVEIDRSNGESSIHKEYGTVDINTM